MTTPILGMIEWAAAQSSPWLVENIAKRTLEWFATGAPVQSRVATDPAALSPSDGQAWLIGSSAVGAWAGKDGEIAFVLGGGFVYFAPTEGLRLFVKDEGALIVLDGGDWKQIGTPQVFLADQAEYDALTPDAGTLYFIPESA